MSTRAAGVPDSRIAFRALTRTFLHRFFENEITGGTQDLKTSSFWLIGSLVAPFTLMPVGAMIRYRIIAIAQGPEALRLLSRPDKTFVIVLGMMVAALIAAVVWHSLMLERRDGLILGALPVRGRTVVQAKLAALAIYVFGIAAAMHGLAAVGYGILLSDRSESLQLALMGPFAHFAATVGSCAFVFLTVTAIQGLTLALTGPTGFRRISSFLQVALVTGIVIAFSKVPLIMQGVARFNNPRDPMPPEPWLMFAPPIWFLGLYEWMLGSAGPVYGQLAGTALLALTTVLVITLMAYALVYRRVMVRIVESPEDSSGARHVGTLVAWVTRRLSRQPVRRAAAQFFFASIGRVERLRFVVAVTIGLLCAWIVPTLSLMVSSAAGPPSPGTTFALSYAAMLLVLVGLRIAASMPADLRAGWMMPMIDAPGSELRSGVWRALFVSSVFPVTVAFAALHVWLWDAKLALVHAGVMLAVGALLVEMSLWHFDDMSNRRPWRPEGVNFRFWWPAYLTGFFMMTRTLPRLEWWVQDSVVATVAIAGTCLAAAAALRIAHNHPYPVATFDIETFVEAPHVLKLD